MAQPCKGSNNKILVDLAELRPLCIHWLTLYVWADPKLQLIKHQPYKDFHRSVCRLDKLSKEPTPDLAIHSVMRTLFMMILKGWSRKADAKLREKGVMRLNRIAYRTLSWKIHETMNRER